MNVSEINIVGFNDSHLGSRNVPINIAIKNLTETIVSQLTDAVDLFVIVGDLLDAQLTLNSLATLEVIAFIKMLVVKCMEHRIFIRYVRGTYMHDGVQPNLFKIFDNDFVIGKDLFCDVVSTLSVETIHELGITVLYKPDDLPTKRASELIDSKLKDLGIAQVDLFLNHGYIDCLIPTGLEHVPDNTIALSDIERWVKGLCINGHIHQRYVGGKLVNNGCVESSRFDEIGDTGGFKILYRPKDGSYEYTFLKNVNSTVFDEIVLPEGTVSEIVQYVTPLLDAIEKIPSSNPTRFVRFISNDTALYRGLRSALSDRKAFRFKHKQKSKAVRCIDEVTVKKFESSVTRENYVERLHETLPTLSAEFIQWAIMKEV